MESIGRAFKTRAAASSWVFNSETVICSFDCLVVADIPQPVFADPSLKAVYIKTDATLVLTPDNLQISQTAQNIAIANLPTTGTLVLSGVAVTAGQSIPVASVASGLLTFVPTGAGTAVVDLTYTATAAGGNVLSSIVNTYPSVKLPLVTPLNNAADGGEFTLNISTNGFNLNAGDFNTTTSGHGPPVMDSGNFDAGGVVILPPPGFPAGVPSTNGSVDPEVSYGITVKDSNNNTINNNTLSTAAGEFNSIINVIVDFDIKVEAILVLSYSFLEKVGWDYGGFPVPLGTNIDMGTIPSPNQYTLNFGTFSNPAEPVLQSSVV